MLPLGQYITTREPCFRGSQSSRLARRSVATSFVELRGAYVTEGVARLRRPHSSSTMPHLTPKDSLAPPALSSWRHVVVMPPFRRVAAKWSALREPASKPDCFGRTCGCRQQVIQTAGPPGLNDLRHEDCSNTTRLRPFGMSRTSTSRTSMDIRARAPCCNGRVTNGPRNPSLVAGCADSDNHPTLVVLALTKGYENGVGY
jgi:hypothetical protein